MDSVEMDIIKNGFDKNGTHIVTDTLFNTAGYDKEGNHKATGTKFNEEGIHKANWYRIQ